MDFNAFNNDVSISVLEADRLGELLEGLGFNANIRPCRTVHRGNCPIHGGDSGSFVIRTDGHTLPIYWACHTQHCEKTYKPSLLGLVRGLLTVQGDKDVGVMGAVKYLKSFLGGEVPVHAKRMPQRPPPEPKLSDWTREQVRSRLVIPSPYFVKRGFDPAIMDRFDVGHSTKLGRSVVPFYDDGGERCIAYLARSERPYCEKCRGADSLRS